MLRSAENNGPERLRLHGLALKILSSTFPAEGSMGIVFWNKCIFVRVRQRPWINVMANQTSVTNDAGTVTGKNYQSLTKNATENSWEKKCRRVPLTTRETSAITVHASCIQNQWKDVICLSWLIHTERSSNTCGSEWGKILLMLRTRVYISKVPNYHWKAALLRNPCFLSLTIRPQPDIRHLFCQPQREETALDLNAWFRVAWSKTSRKVKICKIIGRLLTSRAICTKPAMTNATPASSMPTTIRANKLQSR